MKQITERDAEVWMAALTVASNQMTDAIRNAPLDVNLGWLISARNHADDACMRILEHLADGSDSRG